MGKDLHVLIRSFEFCLIDKHRSTKEKTHSGGNKNLCYNQQTTFFFACFLYSPCLLILLTHCCFHLFVDCNKQLWKIFFFFLLLRRWIIFFCCCSIFFACLHKSHQANSPQCSFSSYFFLLWRIFHFFFNSSKLVKFCWC